MYPAHSSRNRTLSASTSPMETPFMPFPVITTMLRLKDNIILTWTGGFSSCTFYKWNHRNISVSSFMLQLWDPSLLRNTIMLCLFFFPPVEYPMLCELTISHLANLLLMDNLHAWILQMILLVTFLYTSCGYEKGIPSCFMSA